MKFQPEYSTVEKYCRERTSSTIGKPVIVLRAWLYGCAGLDCRVYIERITRQTTEKDTERSPAEWTYARTYGPQPVGHSRRRGRYVDLGVAEGQRWQPATEKARERGDWFTEPGIYTLDLVVESAGREPFECRPVSLWFPGDFNGFDFSRKAALRESA
jgi:hypothetical protein